MQRRLIIMRHAKSSWSTGDRDHDRPLNARGRRDAPVVARRLRELEWVPEAVFSSSAQRTRETWKRMAPEFASTIPAEFERALYLAGLRQLESWAQRWPDERTCVLVLGHNPGWEKAASTLSSTNLDMTTANACLLHGEGSSWVEALSSDWQMEALLRPRELR